MLSQKQRDELNYAIADYLKTCGYDEVLEGFRRAAALEEKAEGERDKNLLEKKWTSVVRLQKKVMELESKLYDLKDEVRHSHGGPRQQKKQEDWIPRGPELYCLEGHRGQILRVIFNPKWQLMASASEDASIKIWDYENGQMEKTLRGHTAAVQVRLKYFAKSFSVICRFFGNV